MAKGYGILAAAAEGRSVVHRHKQWEKGHTTRLCPLVNPNSGHCPVTVEAWHGWFGYAPRTLSNVYADSGSAIS